MTVKMINKVQHKLLPLLLCLILLLPLSGCWGDRFFRVHGTVYERTNASVQAKSEILHKERIDNQYVGDEIPDNWTLTPLSNASVHISINKPREPDIISKLIITDDKGNFRFSTTGPPFQKNVSISVEVSQEGYFPIKREFIDNMRPHELNIILVREYRQ